MDTQRIGKAALGAALLAALAVGTAFTGTAAAGGGGGTDLVMLHLDIFCPERITLDGAGFNFSCYSINSTGYPQGSVENKRLTLSGNWKVRCGDGTVVNLANFSIDIPIDRREGKFPAASFPNPCGGGYKQMAIDLQKSLSNYGVGKNFSTRVTPNFHN